MGRDEWAQFYQDYVVLGAKCTATFTSQTGTNQYPAAIGIQVHDGASLGTADMFRLIEAGRSSWKINANHPNVGIPTNKLTACMSTKKFFKVTDVNDNISRLGASTSTAANPTEMAYFILWTLRS